MQLGQSEWAGCCVKEREQQRALGGGDPNHVAAACDALRYRNKQRAPPVARHITPAFVVWAGKTRPSGQHLFRSPVGQICERAVITMQSVRISQDMAIISDDYDLIPLTQDTH